MSWDEEEKGPVEGGCVLCGRDDNEDNLLLCRNFLKCRHCVHLECMDLYATPVGGWLCDECDPPQAGRGKRLREGSREEFVDEEKRVAVEEEEDTTKRLDKDEGYDPAVTYLLLPPVSNATLLEFAAGLLSKERDGLNQALGMLKENVAQMPPKHIYLAMDEAEQAKLEQRSLLFAWLQKSPKCKEIFDEVKDTFATSPTYVLLVEILEMIIRFNWFRKTIRANVEIARQVVRVLVPKMNILFESNRKGPTMVSLLLLRAVANLSLSATSDLLGALNRTLLNELMHRVVGSDTKFGALNRQAFAYANSDMPDDVRSMACKLVFVFLRNADSRLKEQLLTLSPETRFVHSAFAKLSEHNASTISEGIQVLRRCIIKDRFIARRIKTRFFTQSILGELGLLVHRFHHRAASSLIEYMLTSHYEGIVFPEDEWAPELDRVDQETRTPEVEADLLDPDHLDAEGIAPDNQDDVTSSSGQTHAISALRGSSNTHILWLLEKLCPWRSSLERDLVQLALRLCPRLAPLYLRFEQSHPSRFANILYPRNCSASWLCGMAFVKSYLRDAPIPVPGPWQSDARMLEFADRIVPSLPSLVQWRKSLRSPFGLVRLVTLEALLCILKRCARVDRSSALSIGALSYVQKHRLPHIEAIQTLILEEKDNGKHLVVPSSQMILGAALRVLNIYVHLFEDSSAASGSMWAGCMSTPWSRVPAIEQMGLASQGWWLKENQDAARDIFALLASRPGDGSTALRSFGQKKSKQWSQVCVSNIFFECPDSAVIAVLERFGKVKKFDRRKEGLAFVDFEDPSVAEKAVENPEHVNLDVVFGEAKRRINIDHHQKQYLDEVQQTQFKVLDARRNPLLRQAVWNSALAMLDRTELFAANPLDREKQLWLNAVQTPEDADILIHCTGRHLGCIPPMAITISLFRDRPVLQRSLSPLFQAVCDRAMRGSSDTYGPQYFVRLVFELAHHSSIDPSILLELVEEMCRLIPANVRKAEDAARAVSVLQGCIEMLSILTGRLSQLKYKDLSPKWWDNAEFLSASANPHQVFFWAISSKCSWSSVLKEYLFHENDERLCDQAICYLQHCDSSFVSGEGGAFCFELLWRGLEQRSFDCSTLVERILTNRNFLDICLASQIPYAVMCLGECLTISSEQSSLLARVILSSDHLSRGAVLLPLLDWTQVPSSVLNEALQRVVRQKDLSSARRIVGAAWPNVVHMSGWVQSFHRTGKMTSIGHGFTASSPDPFWQTLTMVAETLSSSPLLEEIVLYWALLGFGCSPGENLVSQICQRGPSDAVAALLAVWSKASKECATWISRLWKVPTVPVPSKTHLVPALILTNTGDLTDDAEALLDECLAGRLAHVWLELVLAGDVSEKTQQLIRSAWSADSKLAASPAFLAMSSLSAIERLARLIPSLSQSDASMLPPMVWEAAGRCLLDLPHVAEWRAEDPPLQIVHTALRYPVESAFNALASAVCDSRTNPGWVERACREIIQSANLATMDFAVPACRCILAMIQRRPNLCTPDFVGRILSMYNGSCSMVDRSLLVIFRFCQEHGAGLESVGGLWGGDSLGVGGAGSVQSSFYEGQLIDSDRLAYSLRNFPVFRRDNLSMEQESLEFSEKDQTEGSSIYDPAFILPFFQFALRRFEAEPKVFFERGFVGYALLGCSCEDEAIRRHAYAVIQLMWNILENPILGFKWKGQARLLMASFRNAIVQPLQRISTILGLFLARFSLVICQPDHFMYEAVNKYLLASPVFDLSRVPLTYECFLGKSESRKRNWWLQNVAESLVGRMDVNTAQRFHLIELWMSFADHIADFEERHLILNILAKATSGSPQVARLIDGRFGILGWFVANASHSRERSQVLEIAAAILKAWKLSDMSFYVKNLGWRLGMTMLGRADSTFLIRSSLNVLGLCEGAMCTEEQTRLILDRGGLVLREMEKEDARHADLEQLILSLAAGCPVRMTDDSQVISDVLGLIALSGELLKSHVSAKAVAWLNGVIGRVGSVRMVGLKGRSTLRRLMTLALIRGDADLKRELGVFVCLYVRMSRKLPAQLEKDFVATLRADAVDTLLNLGSLLLDEDDPDVRALQRVINLIDE